MGQFEDVDMIATALHDVAAGGSSDGEALPLKEVLLDAYNASPLLRGNPNPTAL